MLQYTLSQKTMEISESMYWGGSPREGEFPGNSWKLGIISSDYWDIFPPEDFLAYTLGNLLCFWDSVFITGESLWTLGSCFTDLKEHTTIFNRLSLKKLTTYTV